MITANSVVDQQQWLAVCHFVTMRRHNERLKSIRSNRLLQHRLRLWHVMGRMGGSVAPYGTGRFLDRRLRLPMSGVVQGAKEGPHLTFAAKASGSPLRQILPQLATLNSILCFFQTAGKRNRPAARL